MLKNIEEQIVESIPAINVLTVATGTESLSMSDVYLPLRPVRERLRERAEAVAMSREG